MKNNHPDEQQYVIGLLKKLGESRADYPPELLSTTRAAFQQKVSSVRAQMVDAGTTKCGDTTTFPSEKIIIKREFILQIALITMLIGILMAGIYLMHDKWVNLFIKGTPTPFYGTPANDTATLETHQALTGATATSFPTMMLINSDMTTQSVSTAILHGGPSTSQTPVAPMSTTLTQPKQQTNQTSATSTLVVTAQTVQPTSQTPTDPVPTFTAQPAQPTDQTPSHPASTETTQPASWTPISPTPIATTQPESPANPTPTQAAPTATTHPGLHLGQTPGTPAAPGQIKTPQP